MLSKDVIVKLLQENDVAVARALVVLYEHQTMSEQATESTRNKNGEGFRPAHARMGTSMAKFYLSRKFLSAKQVAYWRKPMADGNTRIGIYWKQLALAAERKAEAKKVAAAPIDDVGNMSETLMVLEEQFADYQDSDDFPKLEAMQEQISFLRKEIARAYAAM